MTVIEGWKPVEWCPLYEVSKLGNVRRNGRILKPRVHSHGYLRVHFSIEGKHTDHYIHRLVCEAFHGPPPNGHHADHINGNRADNKASNLRWLSASANRALRLTAKGSRNGTAKLTEDDVIRIREAPVGHGQYTALANEFGVGRNAIARIVSGKGWTHV